MNRLMYITSRLWAVTCLIVCGILSTIGCLAVGVLPQWKKSLGG
jgi:hypothetical protein